MENNSIAIEEIHRLTTNSIFNYSLNQNENDSTSHNGNGTLLRNIARATAIITAFSFTNDVNMHSKNQEHSSAIYSNQNVKVDEKLINSTTNILGGYLIDEEGMRLVTSEEEVRQRDLDSVKETIEAKLDTVNVRIENVSEDITEIKDNMKESFSEIKDIISDIKTTIDSLPTEDYVNNTANKLLIKVGSGAVLLIGLVIAYLEWRFV